MDNERIAKELRRIAGEIRGPGKPDGTGPGRKSPECPSNEEDEDARYQEGDPEDAEVVVSEEKIEQQPLKTRTPKSSRRIRAQDETLGDVLKDFPTRWENWGDADYIAYGGLQVKYDGSGEFELAELVTPDAGYPGYLIQTGDVDIDEIFEDADEDTPVSELRPTSDAQSAAKLVGAEWGENPDLDSVRKFIFDVLMSSPGYGVLDEHMTFKLEDYNMSSPRDMDDPEHDDDIERIQGDVEEELESMGLDL